MSHPRQYRPSDHPTRPELLSGYWGGYDFEQMVYTPGSPPVALTGWTEKSGTSARDLSPASSQEVTERRFNGMAGCINNDSGMNLSASVAMGPPMTVYAAVRRGSSGTVMIPWGNTSQALGFRIANGDFTVRTNSENANISNDSPVETGKKSIICFVWQSNGDLEAYLLWNEDGNTASYTGSANATDNITCLGVGAAGAQNDGHIGAVYVFEAAHSAHERQVMLVNLLRFTRPTYGLVGMSNTRDYAYGNTLFSNYLAWDGDDVTAYSGDNINSWNNTINDPVDSEPWLSYEAAVAKYIDTGALLVQPAMPGNAESATPALQSALSNVIAEARRILGKGDVDAFLIPMPYYIQTGLNPTECPRTRANTNASYQLIEWAKANLTNCYSGPIPVNIDGINERTEPEGPCHVQDEFFDRDGSIWHGFLGGL